MPHEGLLISFEGGEGCGKSTQIRLLAEWLKECGYEAPIFREPGGTGTGEQIRQILQHCREAENMTPHAELLLFAASRAQLVREEIAPARASGAIVLCDRFLDSTTVYQGVARQLPSTDVDFINTFATGGLLPDKTFFLDLPWEAASQRLAERSAPENGYDRMEAQPAAFHQAVRTGYLALAEKYPDRIVTIQATHSIEEIASQLKTHLTPLLHNNGISKN